jgi:murein DD-endopeptidase MepM/ murein hydrolase activator NlpD
MDLFAVSPDVFAPESGTIVRITDGKSTPFSGYGPGVVLMHGDSGFYHLLSHLVLSSINVRSGQRVLDGQRIARFDPEIRHTHYEVRREATGPSETNTVNPLLWFASRQRQLVATAPPKPKEPSNTGGVLVGAVIVTGLVGLGWLAVRAAKYTASPA